MATLTSLKRKSNKPAASQGRYSPNRDVYTSPHWRHVRDTLLGPLVNGKRPNAPLCVLCLKKPTPVATLSQVVDHITPINQGGADDWDNYQCVCEKCHNSKSAKERWSKTKKAI